MLALSPRTRLVASSLLCGLLLACGAADKDTGDASGDVPADTTGDDARGDASGDPATDADIDAATDPVDLDAAAPDVEDLDAADVDVLDVDGTDLDVDDIDGTDADVEDADGADATDIPAEVEEPDAVDADELADGDAEDLDGGDDSADADDVCPEAPAPDPASWPSLPAMGVPPTLGSLWAAVTDGYTNGSPSVVDLDGDGVMDVVGGGGIEGVVGTVVAVSGVDGHSIWSVSLRDEVFTRPVTLLIDDDCTPDVVIGGRRGLLIAVSGATGDVIWSFNDGVDPGDDGIFNWFTPQVVPDLDGDGRPELLLANGGDATAPPFSPRPPGHVMILDAETGEILRSATTPDLRETYMSPLLLDRLGEPWLLVGTGGETAQGALWIVRYSDLLDEDLSDATQLTTPTTTKGVMAPPSLADLNGDGQRDIVVSVFDGRTIAIDGVTLEPLWTFTTPRQAESYQSPAIARLDELDGDDVFAVFTYGVFPNYTGVYRVALSGRTGAVLWSDEAAENVTCSPLAADLDGDGRDELLHSAGMFGSAVSSHLDVLSGADRSGFTVLPRDTASVGAGWVGDLDGDGRLEWVTMSFRETESGGQWLIERRDLGAPSEPAPRWGAYLGSDGTGR